MNSSARKFYTIFMFFCLVIILLISTSESMGTFPHRCIKKSTTWEEKHCIFDIPTDNWKCNSTCVNLEHAVSGICQSDQHPLNFPTNCYCSFKCNENMPRKFYIISTFLYLVLFISAYGTNCWRNKKHLHTHIAQLHRLKTSL
ncbi:unnamed protein product [Trifolium pratense]|uniref:Uncharacterized protein n=1 Tax=Trifolium pratense TaxID=57577 RepID=A0ACB0IU32_TRIPR|nr:unnamed protein product [Trifolium pratense]